MTDLPAGLTERFHPSQVKKNPKGQDYISIDGYINRLNEILGTKWAWTINHIEWNSDVMPPTRNGQQQFMAVVHGTLTIVTDDIGFTAMDEANDVLTSMRSLSSRDGLGAGVNYDPDTALKTAQAEALKKACHQYGIALYLWDEEERDFVEMQRKAANDDTALKRLVMEYTIRQKGLDPDEQPSREAIVEVLGTDDLSPEKMRSILVERGVL